ncbi:hypothetical protein [Kribbella sp. NPDC006257]|uniref:hypothetical protein n=1 Tax=Kribbella sp. NPDC006257 TaxID=3156738 RepID=UPI0033B7C2D7
MAGIVGHLGRQRGGDGCPEQYTEQGWELQFATNHLGHFALATGLHAAMVAAGNARIVVVSSSGH